MPEPAPHFDDDPDDDGLAAVDRGLDDANRRAAPQLADVRTLGCVARDSDGTVIGGAVGRTWGDCAELQQLWVDARQRGRGLGTALLRRFEARAAARGCTLVYCSSFSFQAPASIAAGATTRRIASGASPPASRSSTTSGGCRPAAAEAAPLDHEATR